MAQNKGIVSYIAAKRKTVDKMDLLIKYIKQHIKAVVLYFVFVLVFTCIFMLYKLPVMAVVYAGSICLFIGIIALVLNFILFVKETCPPAGAHKRYKGNLRTFAASQQPA